MSSTRVEGKRVIRTKTSSWELPYCQGCAAHDRAWPTIEPIGILILTVLTCGLYLYFYVKQRQRAVAMCTPSCARPQEAVAYLGWHGTVHRFELASPVFAHAFLAANAKKVVGADSHARQLMAAPPPAPRPVSAPPPVVASPPKPPSIGISPPSPKPTPMPPSTTRDGFYGSNTTVTVAGRTLHSPLAYIAATDVRVDASTIITSLRVGNAASAEELPYWPSYVGASTAQRAMYLDWHASGRSNPQTPIGYVFMHFYGLERRVLVDRADLDLVRAELKRLLAIYGPLKQSFRGYASALLAFIALPQIPELSEDAIYAQLGEIADIQPTAMSGLLAWFSVHDRPLPSRLAMAVARSMEDAKGGTAVKRAREELEELFTIRYRERFGAGLHVEAAKRPETVAYHPGSPSLLGSTRKPQVAIPHVLGRTSQFKPVVELWNACVADLKKLSFTRRTDASAPMTAEAWLALPPELRDGCDHPQQEAWDTMIGSAPRLGAFRVVSAGRLAALAGFEVNGRVTAVRLRKAVELAAQLGYAIEPDARAHAQSVAAEAELAIWESTTTAPPDVVLWRSIHTMLSLTLSIAVADGGVSDEEAHTVHTVIANLFPLDDAMRTRVAALRMLLTRQPARVNAIAKKLRETRTTAELVKIGRVLVTVAAVDGVITDDEHRALKSLYKAFGLAPAELATAIAGSGARFEADATVQVRGAVPAGVGEAIPPPPELTAPHLDQQAIEAILAETREVASILAGVLDDTDEDSEPVASTTRPLSGSGPWSALDSRYHDVLRELLTRSAWTIPEVRALATKEKLMPGAILEAVNGWSEDRFGDFVIEEAGDWKINAHLLSGQSA